MEKPYNFRKLKGCDVAPMCKIISKIGINEFTKCFESEAVLKAIKGNKKNSAMTDIVGLQAFLEVANVILSHIPDCEKEIMTLLGNVSGLDPDVIRDFELPIFTQMVIDFVKKEEFSDFIGVASGLFK